MTSKILHNVFYYPVLTTASSLIEAFLCSLQSSIVNELSHYIILPTVPKIEKPSESWRRVVYVIVLPLPLKILAEW